MASLSNHKNRADFIYRFLLDGFKYGENVLNMMHLDSVFSIFELCRFVGNENHLLTGFLRFSKTEEGLLVSKIAPKNDVITLLANHFSDRISEENWIIYDEKRKKGIVHAAGKSWVVFHDEDKLWMDKIKWKTDEQEYQDLWRTFHRSIAIPERANYRCQRNHLPLRYRPYMTEFKD